MNAREFRGGSGMFEGNKVNTIIYNGIILKSYDWNVSDFNSSNISR